MKFPTFVAVSIAALALAGPAGAAVYGSSDGSMSANTNQVLAPIAAAPAYRMALKSDSLKIGEAGGWVVPPTVPEGQRIPLFVGPTSEGGSPQ
jgi:hypothetical protein